MKILFIGDIMGKPGRRAVRELLPKIVGDYNVDMIIANGENAAGGFGMTQEVVEELYKNHIDVLTSGNHIWDKKETTEFIDDYETLLRPANYPGTVPGKGSCFFSKAAGGYVGVLNLMGRVFMPPLDCPFRTAEREIEKLKSKTNTIIVDFHAEATSEKEAIGWFLDGKVSAVLGTHTHVQTADERVLPQGTAYISDVGMTGPFDSIIGVSIDDAMQRFLTGIPHKFEVAKKNVWLQSVLIDVDDDTGKSRSIERLNRNMKD
jgi:2',3'-cyclic-nucleotide 2'-phosphodiesterase